MQIIFLKKNVVDGGTTAFPVESTRLDKFFSFNKKSNSYYFAVGDNAMTPHFMTRSGINHGFQHVQMVEKNFLTKIFSSITDTKLSTHNKAMHENSEKLFAKPVTDEFFKDGPFLKNLTKSELSMVDYLTTQGVSRVDYTNILRILKENGITITTSDKKLSLIAKFLQENPRASADDLNIFVRNL